MRFKDRTDAGRQLARALEPRYAGQEGIVYPLPRGGITLAVEVARALEMPIDLVIPRKIGHPLNPEYAICAVTESGERVCNERERARVDPEWLEQACDRARQESKRRRQRYLADTPSVPAEDKVAIIVDDGIATGLTMQAAIRDVRARGPARIVVAVPAAPREVAVALEGVVDEVVGLDISEDYLGSVGAYYQEFPQVTDEEAVALLQPFKAAGDHRLT